MRPILSFALGARKWLDDLATSKFNYSAYVEACGAEQCTFKKDEFSAGTFVSQVFSLQLR